MSWIIGSGEYSDYHVVAVCPTQEIADEVVAALTERAPGFGGQDSIYGHDDSFRVEEIPDLTDSAMVRHRLIYSVAIRVDPTSNWKQESEFAWLTYSLDGSDPDAYQNPEVSVLQPGSSTYQRNWEVHVTDFDLAKCWKIARDTHAKWEAERQGL